MDGILQVSRGSHGVKGFGQLETEKVALFYDQTVDNNCHTWYKRLVELGVSDKNARAIGGSRKGPWALSSAKPLKVAMPNQFFAQQGLLNLLDQQDAVR